MVAKNAVARRRRSTRFEAFMCSPLRSAFASENIWRSQTSSKYEGHPRDRRNCKFSGRFMVQESASAPKSMKTCDIDSRKKALRHENVFGDVATLSQFSLCGNGGKREGMERWLKGRSA